MFTTRAPATFSSGSSDNARRDSRSAPRVAVGGVAPARHACVACGGAIPDPHGRFITLAGGHVHQGCKGVRVGIETPTVVSKVDLMKYLRELEPYVERMNADIKEKTYNLTSEPMAKLISKLRKDGATEEEIHQETMLVQRWKGWGFLGEDGEPEHPGYYRTWLKNKEQIEEGIIDAVYPWYAPLFLPAAPIIFGASVVGADRRKTEWNNLRDGHKQLDEIRRQLVDLGYTPSDKKLPDLPGTVGALGIGPLGDDPGKGKAKSWYESLPIGWIVFGFVLIAGAMALGQVRGLAGKAAA